MAFGFQVIIPNWFGYFFTPFTTNQIFCSCLKCRKYFYFLYFSVRIIETEAYYGKGKAGILSHSYHKNKSKSERFDSGIIPGTVYMYFAHGGDSINFSCGNQGSAVLINSTATLDSTVASFQVTNAWSFVSAFNPLVPGIASNSFFGSWPMFNLHTHLGPF